MATCPIRLQFLCDKVVERLNFNHPVPESLVTPLSLVRQESSFADRFPHAVLPFLKEHEAACCAASDPFCVSCGSSITTVLQTPMSYLHKAGDPHVSVIVNGVCMGRPNANPRRGRPSKKKCLRLEQGARRRLEARVARYVERGNKFKSASVQGGRILWKRSPVSGLEETQERVCA